MSSENKATPSIINVSDAKTQLSALLEQVASGRTLVIGKAGKPLAKLVPYSEKKTARKFGALKGKIKFHGDFNFDDQELQELFDI